MNVEIQTKAFECSSNLQDHSHGKFVVHQDKPAGTLDQAIYALCHVQEKSLHSENLNELNDYKAVGSDHPCLAQGMRQQMA